MRHLSSLLLALTLTALPLSAAHAEDAAKPTKSTAAKHTKRKTASKAPAGAIGVDKLKQEVAGHIKQSEQGVTGAARQHLEGAVAQVKAKLAGAVRDGKVTPVELKQVRDSYHLMAVKPAAKEHAKPAAKKTASKPTKEHAAKPKKKIVQGENDQGLPPAGASCGPAWLVRPDGLTSSPSAPATRVVRVVTPGEPRLIAR